MPPAERSRARPAVYTLLVVLGVLVAIPAYLLVPVDWRPAAVRLACALLVIVGCRRIVAHARRALDGEAASPLDAQAPGRERPVLDERFQRLRDDIVFGARSRRYFDTILWPRLQALAGGTLTAPPARRRVPRRGPSLRTLERLIAAIERRP
jgi:hypothetical protein